MPWSLDPIRALETVLHLVHHLLYGADIKPEILRNRLVGVTAREEHIDNLVTVQMLPSLQTHLALPIFQCVEMLPGKRDLVFAFPAYACNSLPRLTGNPPGVYVTTDIGRLKRLPLAVLAPFRGLVRLCIQRRKVCGRCPPAIQASDPDFIIVRAKTFYLQDFLVAPDVADLEGRDPTIPAFARKWAEYLIRGVPLRQHLGSAFGAF